MNDNKGFVKLMAHQEKLDYDTWVKKFTETMDDIFPHGHKISMDADTILFPKKETKK